MDYLILTKLNYFQKFFNKALSRFSGRSGAAKKHPGARILFHERPRFPVKNKIVLKKPDLFNGLTNSQESKVKIHKIQFLMKTIFTSKSQCASSHVSPLPISTSSGTSSPTTFSIVSFTISQSSSSSSLDASKISSSWTVRIILDCIRFS